MNKEDVLRKSREENANGDEFVKSKEAKALNNGYLVSHLALLLLIAEFSYGDSKGIVMINQMNFEVEDVLFFIFWLSLLIRNISEYIYLKRKKNLVIALFFLLCLLMNLSDMLGLF